MLCLGFQAFCFEGIFQIHIVSYYKDVPDSQYCTWMFKGKQVKMTADIHAQKVHMKLNYVPSLENKKVLLYNEVAAPDGKKYASWLNMNQIQVDSGKFALRIQVEKTDESEKIAGVQCNKYIVRTDKEVLELWLYPCDIHLEPILQYFPNTCFRALVKENIQGFPLRVLTKDFGGSILEKWETTRVTAEKVSSESFVLPAGYDLVNF